MSLGAGLSRAGLARPKHGQQSTGKPWTAGSGLRKALPPVSVPELPWTAGRGGRSAVRGDAEDGGGGGGGGDADCKPGPGRQSLCGAGGG